MRKSSLAHVVGWTAVLVFAGGTSAYGLSGTNTVDSGDIKNGQVKGVDIAKNAITGTKVKDGSLTAADLKPGTIPAPFSLADGSVTSAKIADGTVGTADIANGSINGAKVADHSLTGVDIAVSSGTFTYNPSSIAANSCSLFAIQIAPGVNMTQTAIVVTAPSTWDDIALQTMNSANPDGWIRLQACNPTISAIDPPSTTFRYLAITP